MNKPTILIVEDDDFFRDAICDLLKKKYEVLAAPSGKVAKEIMLLNELSLVISDIQMPGLTGFEVCEKLKSDPATADIVIVMLTAHGQSTDRERAASVGADHFMTKPFSPVQLLRLVGQIL